MCSVTLSGVRLNMVAVEKQQVLPIIECECV